ncbi:hypothetical protein GQ53DRAFT_786662 [Thozetella sp. PMI_491]|nr:hypothetical protein GQ53DRAFT_786662 [Thozetella sp. PMI_491]
MASTYDAQYDAQYDSSYYHSGPLPIPVSGKGQYDGYYQSNDSTYSVSPPEADGSMTSGSVVPSYSVTNSSYAGSQCDGDSSMSVSGVDINEYMQERFHEAYDPIPLDRSTVVQAQTSGKLNAKHRELLEMQAKAQARLAKARARFAEGMEDAREVRADLEWTQKKLSSTKAKAAKKHPKEFAKARARYPSPEY